MIYAVMWGYVSGWLVAAIVLAVIVKRLNDPSSPQPHPIRVAVAAGAVWPLVILGATQMAAVALVVDATRCRTRRVERRASNTTSCRNSEGCPPTIRRRPRCPAPTAGLL